MKWFAEKYTKQSDKNGTILVRRDFGTWLISVNGCGQTGEYTREMWVQAFKRLSTLHTIKNNPSILMLGLGAGGEIKTLHKYFPGCQISVVEYDKEMVALARELKLHEPFPFPEVLLGDAAVIVPAITKQFDFILLDLFLGPEPSPLAQNPQFIKTLRERLLPNGLLLINVYKRAEYLETAKRLFSQSNLWLFRVNNLGAFW